MDLKYFYVVSLIVLALDDISGISEEFLNIFYKNDSQLTELILPVTSSNNTRKSNTSELFYEYFNKLTDDYDNNQSLPMNDINNATFEGHIEILQGDEPSIENDNETDAVINIKRKILTKSGALSRKLYPLQMDVSNENNMDEYYDSFEATSDTSTFENDIKSSLQREEPLIEKFSEIAAAKKDHNRLTGSEASSRKLYPLEMDFSSKNNNDEFDYLKATSDTTVFEHDNIDYSETGNEDIQKFIYSNPTPFTRLKLIITTASKRPYRPRIIGEVDSEKDKKVPEFLHKYLKHNESKSIYRKQWIQIRSNNMTYPTGITTDKRKSNAFHYDPGILLHNVIKMPTGRFTNDTERTTTSDIQSNNNHDFENRNNYLYPDMLNKSRRKLSLLNFDNPDTLLEYFDESCNKTYNDNEPIIYKHAGNDSNGDINFETITIKSNYVTPKSYDTILNIENVNNVKEHVRPETLIEKSNTKLSSQNGYKRLDKYSDRLIRQNYNIPGSFDTMAENLDAMADNLENMAENFDKSPENYNSLDIEPSDRYTYFNTENILPEFRTKQFSFSTKSNSILPSNDFDIRDYIQLSTVKFKNDTDTTSHSFMDFEMHDYIQLPTENLNKVSDSTTHSFMDDIIKDIDAHLDNPQTHISFDKALHPGENMNSKYNIQSEVTNYETSTPEVLDIDYLWKNLNERTDKVDFTTNPDKVSDPIHIRPFIPLEDEIKGGQGFFRKTIELHNIPLNENSIKSFNLESKNTKKSHYNISKINNSQQINIASSSSNNTKWKDNILKPFDNESEYVPLRGKPDNSFPQLFDIIDENDETSTPIQKEPNPKFLKVDTVNENDKLSVVSNGNKGLTTTDSRDVVISQDIIMSPENVPSPNKLNEIKSFLTGIRRRNGLKMENNDYENFAASMLPIIDEMKKHYEKFPAKCVKQNNDAYNAADNIFTFATKRIPSKQNIHSIFGKLK